MADLYIYSGNVNMANSEGMTALHLATVADHHRVVRLLLKNGGDKTIVDNNHKTSLDYAIERVHIYK